MRKALLLVLTVSAMVLPARAEMRDAIVHIRTISVGEIGEPDGYAIVSANGGPQYDSRTFVHHDGGEGAPHPSSLNDAMAAADFRLGEELRTAILDALLKAGHTVVPPGSKDADMRLVAAILPRTVGYSDAVLGDDLMPGFAVRVFLMDAKNNSILSSVRILYGQGEGRDARVLFPDARYRFTSVEALLSDPKSAAAGIRAGVVPVAAEIAKAATR